MERKILLYILLTTGILSFGANAFGEEDRIRGTEGTLINLETFDSFDEPWAMTFISEENLLITEKPGNLYIFDTASQTKTLVEGVPEVAYAGQGGLGDVILHPRFEENGTIYLSYAEEDASGKRGAVVVRARLMTNGDSPMLEGIETIWRQAPKVTGSGHYSHRLAFDSRGYLFITSGERQKMSPAQSWTQNLGKIIRLNEDGSVPGDNPFQDKGELAKSFWTLGHRNLLGIAFDREGRLWTHEMGPRHGDELNLITRGDNYGWPVVSWGNHYSGEDIPDHDTRPDFHEPEEYWVPSVAPSGLIIYQGTMFPDWQGNALLGGLVSESLVRVEIDGDKAQEAERFDMGKRIREVEEGPDGAIWILEDKKGGRLRQITPGD